MKNILNLTLFTVREAFSKKIIITFAGISTFVLFVFILLFSTMNIDEMTSMVQTNNYESEELLAKLAVFFKMLIVVPLFGGGLFLSIFSVSSLIPSMLEKGNVDILLSKPISRSQIIFGKFLGGTLVVFLNIGYLVIGMWLLIGIKFGSWDTSFLLTIFSITFAFATLYSLVILVGILTRSSILAMMLSYLIFFVFSPLLSARENLYLLIDSKWLETILDALYYITPQTSELGTISADIAVGGGVSDSLPIILSSIFMILTISLSIIIFSKKDY